MCVMNMNMFCKWYSVISIELSTVKYLHGFVPATTNRHLMTSSIWMQSILLCTNKSVEQKKSAFPVEFPVLNNSIDSISLFFFFFSFFDTIHFINFASRSGSWNNKENWAIYTTFFLLLLIFWNFILERSSGNLSEWVYVCMRVCVCGDMCISETAIVQMWSRMGSSFNYSMCFHTMALKWILFQLCTVCHTFLLYVSVWMFVLDSILLLPSFWTNQIFVLAHSWCHSSFFFLSHSVILMICWMCIVCVGQVLSGPQSLKTKKMMALTKSYFIVRTGVLDRPILHKKKVSIKTKRKKSLQPNTNKCSCLCLYDNRTRKRNIFINKVWENSNENVISKKVYLSL